MEKKFKKTVVKPTYWIICYMVLLTEAPLTSIQVGKSPLNLLAFKTSSIAVTLKYFPPFPFERIAFAIVPVEVRYPDRIVGIALLLWSKQ